MSDDTPPNGPVIDPTKLTPEQQKARDRFGALIAQGEAAHWELGDFTNTLAESWGGRGQPGKGVLTVKLFYNQVVKPAFGDSAPSYAMVTLYARVAATWSEVVAVNVGMAKLGEIWTWIGAMNWDAKQAQLEELEITFPDPKTGKTVTKRALDATVAEIREAVAALHGPPPPSTHGEDLLIDALDKGLEAHLKGGAALLVQRVHVDTVAFGLRPVDADDIPALVEDLYLSLKQAGFYLFEPNQG